MIDKIKAGIGICLILSVCVLGYLYNNSLNKVAELKAELKTTQAELEKVVTATNKYKETTDKLLSSYSNDLSKWQDKVAEARSDCDARISRLIETENIDIKDIDSVLTNQSSQIYIDEINKRLRDAKNNRSTNSNK